MFGIGTSELLLICILALVVLGPRRLPEIAYKIGKAVGALKRMSAEFQRNLNIEVATLEEKELQRKQQEYDALELPCSTYSPEQAEQEITSHIEKQNSPIQEIDAQEEVQIKEKG